MMAASGDAAGNLYLRLSSQLVSCAQVDQDNDEEPFQKRDVAEIDVVHVWHLPAGGLVPGQPKREKQTNQDHGGQADQRRKDECAT